MLHIREKLGAETVVMKYKFHVTFSKVLIPASMISQTTQTIPLS